MISYFHHKTPQFKHDCSQCQFIVGIERDDGFKIDLYKSCIGSSSQYLIRTGDNPEDYSTPDIKSMAIHYAEVMMGRVIKST